VIVCVCRAVSDRTLRALVRDGARTPEELARATGAGTSCGCCREEIERLVASDHREACREVPCPGCPGRAGADAPPRRVAASPRAD
jgi:bacterioferritin-associated ferredoxin